ncbi:D-3-phosphoglycerate dehydrogenase [Ligilactobacillus salitolerans]|uniref:D-3-phosphoglycerate dehydrogenase n=1 Tax=Ligilactobacillus salitolerans TaxID=1808352 RepID=A0A401IT44_9LACO|nr:phosphoglycerate dehydrogenase [Ligilactobacillus salitolerans]GBG94689.1 D-3-phosphoglycerate dehydrogenase [Ligilactobacillus salitolerans]
MKILVLGGNLIHEGANEAFAQFEERTEDQVIFANESLTDEELSQVDIVLGNKAEMVERILSLPHSRLKWIQAFSAGVDYYPLAKFAHQGILLSNASGIHAEPIAETVFGIMLSQMRGIKEAVLNQADSKWDPSAGKFTLLSGKKMVVFGTGHIGSRIGELGQAFKMETIGINHSGHAAAGFNSTLPISEAADPAIVQADVIVNALPLTKETKGFYDQKFFAKLKRSPLFVNIGRGPSVVTADLISALENGQVGEAGLDVADPEPLPADSPLWQMPNVLITPHVSGSYSNYVEGVLEIFEENLRQYHQDGTLVRNEVDLQKGY